LNTQIQIHFIDQVLHVLAADRHHQGETPTSKTSAL